MSSVSAATASIAAAPSPTPSDSVASDWRSVSSDPPTVVAMSWATVRESSTFVSVLSTSCRLAVERSRRSPSSCQATTAPTTHVTAATTAATVMARPMRRRLNTARALPDIARRRGHRFAHSVRSRLRRSTMASAP